MATKIADKSAWLSQYTLVINTTKLSNKQFSKIFPLPSCNMYTVSQKTRPILHFKNNSQQICPKINNFCCKELYFIFIYWHLLSHEMCSQQRTSQGFPTATRGKAGKTFWEITPWSHKKLINLTSENIYNHPWMLFKDTFIPADYI